MCWSAARLPAILVSSSTATFATASSRLRRSDLIGSFLRRLAFAWDLGDLNVLVSGQITSDSRLLIHRNIRDRVEQIAPFLTLDRKSTRLNSSHVKISYAVFC